MEKDIYTYSKFFNGFDKFHLYRNNEFFGVLYVGEEEVKEIVDDLNNKEKEKPNGK